MSKHEDHQFVEINKGKGEGHMQYKDIMCSECGEKRRMHEDGRIEEMEKKDE